MASDGFRPNFKGYRETLNDSRAFEECDKMGSKVCSRANAAGHGSYEFDTIYGKRRVHTRVKTADRKSFFQERKTHILDRIARRA